MWYINWPERSKVRLVSGHSAEVTGAAYSPDGLHLATGCQDGSLTVWSATTLEQYVVFQAPKKVCLWFSLLPHT